MVVRAYRDLIDGSDPVAMIYGDLSNIEAPYVRVHDACFTSEVLGSLDSPPDSESPVGGGSTLTLASSSSITFPPLFIALYEVTVTVMSQCLFG